jgi:RHS repeat-associated protein
LVLTNAAPDGTTQSFFNYTYDTKGNRLSMTTLSGITTYAYDGLNQLIAVSYPSGRNVTYAYDPLGNRTVVNDTGTNSVYSPNNLNQYTHAGGATLIYDADGNLTSWTDSIGTTTYQYDFENRLVSVTTPTNGVCQYAYDSFGNRTVVVQGGITNTFAFDIAGFVSITAKYNSDGSLNARYDEGAGLIARSDASHNTLFFEFDALGNTRDISDNAGAKVNSYDYDVYGNLNSVNETFPNELRFIGKYGCRFDVDTLYQMKNRYYSSEEGRFTTPDPISYLGGYNCYAYCANTPLNTFDPSGLRAIGLNIPFKIFTIQVSENSDGTRYLGIGVGLGASLYRIPTTGEWQLATPWGGFSYDPKDVVPGISASRSFGVEAGWRVKIDPNGDGITKSDTIELGADIGVQYNISFATLAIPENIAQRIGQQIGTYIINSIDPNALTGPAGFSIQNYVINSDLFGYQITFENKTNATAPAQIVQITDPLSTNLNWSTFQFTEIDFGDTYISVPPNVQHFQTNLPMSYNGVNFQVQIETGINLANGQVFANFFAIDPSTGLPPSVDIGFLPPENGTGRGTGHVSYTVRPKPNLPEGTQITNVATIQFDVNPPIATDQLNDNDPSQGIDTNKLALITIDNVPPISMVSGLPTLETNINFTVCWSGTDVGSGIVGYDINVSANNAPWSLWLAGTTNSCATFNGTNGQIYAFYSIAHDGAGNIEAKAAPAEATTLTPGTSPPTINQIGNQYVLAGQMLLVTNHAHSANTPITFSLAATAPAGASIGSTNGVFSWTPTCVQGSSTNLITVWAADSESSPLSNSMSFSVVVGECVQVSVGSTVMQAGTTSSVPVNLVTTVALTNLSFALAYPTNRFANWTITATNIAVGASSVQTNGPSQTSFNLATTSGQTLQGPTVLGAIHFSALPGQTSAFVPLAITNIAGAKSDGTPVGDAFGQAGRVVVIGSQPLLEAWMATNATRMLTLYGNPGASYQMAFRTNLTTAGWQNGWRAPMTNLYEYFTANQTAPQIFYKAWEFFGEPPILELGAPGTTNLTLLLYGKAGTNYVIEARTNLSNGGVWFPATSFALTNSFQFINEGTRTNKMMFFRAKRP